MVKAYPIGVQTDGYNSGYRMQLSDGPISVCYGPIFSNEDDAWRFHAYAMEHFGGRIKNWFSFCYSGTGHPNSEDLSRIGPLY